MSRPELAQSAATALSKLPGGLDALLQWWTSADPQARYFVLPSLAKAQDPRAGDALVDALRSPDPWVRQRVVAALGERGDSRATAALEGALSREGRRGARTSSWRP